MLSKDGDQLRSKIRVTFIKSSIIFVSKHQTIWIQNRTVNMVDLGHTLRIFEQELVLTYKDPKTWKERRQEIIEIGGNNSIDFNPREGVILLPNIVGNSETGNPA